MLELFPPSIPAVEPVSPGASSGSKVLLGDSLELLKSLPSDQVHTCVTSPPYWGLRDYGIAGQIGAEQSVDEFIQKLVSVFREVRRVLRPDGTLWLNIGDCYTSGGRTWRDADKKNAARGMSYRPATPTGLKPKDLVGVPWRLAFALQADGWFLRSDVVWHKPNGLPESVKDRPSRTHEFVFLLSRSEDYYYDHDATKEPAVNGRLRSMRSVWSINTEPLKEAHFAAFPTALVSRCLAASCPTGGVALDPFFGAGTVGVVCQRMGRSFIGIELNPEYVEIARKRLGWPSGQ
jgi:site-specific DNA-methyltransferase (cytosine-N4-specific)